MKPNAKSPELKNAISVEKMRRSDAYTIEHFVESKELMYRAAMGVYNAVSWPEHAKVFIFCGSGNNGGDGYALASILQERGHYPTVFCVSEKFSPDGKYYFDKAKAAGVPVFSYTENSCAGGADVIVDCIFGTGFHGEPRGAAAAAIRNINEMPAYTVSVDINSGMNGDTGEAVLAVKSDLTVSIGFYKTGHFLGRAEQLIGELVNVDIGIILLPDGQ